MPIAVGPKANYLPNQDPDRPSWLGDLEREGYAVVRNVIPADLCEEFQDEALTWLEKFPHGFKRDDRSTWTSEHLPSSSKGGLYNRYSVNHEAFVWKIRALPQVQKVFETIYGTDDLIASFDGMNATFPVNPKTGRTDIKQTDPWPHIDQDCRKVNEFELIQGIAQMSQAGPDDGGLVVLARSHLLHQEHFNATGGPIPEQDGGISANSYSFHPPGGSGEEQLGWYKDRGCEVIKVEANIGDFIVWDSRTIHWNKAPTGDVTRFISYVCMCPKSYIDEKGLQQKIANFRNRKGTTHLPNENVVPEDRTEFPNHLPRRPDGSVDPANRARPFVEPIESPEVLRLVGIRA